MPEEHDRNDGRGSDASAPPQSFRATDHQEGQEIGGKYRLMRRLGQGGMASVWLAHNEALDIDVAIKFIRADLQHPGLTSRLLQEARAAAKLGHPAIVRVTDFGKTETQQPYIVMELLRGHDLAKVVAERGAIPAVRAVRTLLPIANALAAAHAKGIVHRDLKPENVFLHQREDGGVQPKLVDFGIAKLKVEDGQRITQLGNAMGSPAYMSPEQARGLDVDHRADVWAFCVLLYEVLTTRLPFDGPTYAALLCAILEGQPKPITELGVPDPQLWALIARGLEKEPEKRWDSMRELGTALAHWLQARGVADDIAGASLLSTWIDPQPESDRMPQHSLPALPSLPDLERPTALAESVGDGATQLSFHEGPAAQSPRKGRGSLAIAGGIGVVLLLGGAVAFLVARPRAAPEPAPVVAAPPVTDTETVPPVESAREAPPPPSAAPAVVPTTQAAEDEAAAPAPKPQPRKPLPRTPAPAKTAQPPTATTAQPKPKPPESSGELDIKTNL